MYFAVLCTPDPGVNVVVSTADPEHAHLERLDPSALHSTREAAENHVAYLGWHAEVDALLYDRCEHWPLAYEVRKWADSNGYPAFMSGEHPEDFADVVFILNRDNPTMDPAGSPHPNGW